jgi:hypothetical protein
MHALIHLLEYRKFVFLFDEIYFWLFISWIFQLWKKKCWSFIQESYEISEINLKSKAENGTNSQYQRKK